MLTLNDYLQAYLERPEIQERVKPFFTACEGLLNAYSALIQRASVAPHSLGYEPWLVARGVQPIFARMIARNVVRRGERIARDQARRARVVQAIHFLAQPRCRRSAIARRTRLLLEAWDETSVIETIFDDAGISGKVFAFIQVLRSSAEGDAIAWQRLTEIAASLVPNLPVRRGRKVRAASAAHEFFLETVIMRFKQHSFTWDPIKREFSDSASQATGREFGIDNFDPRPACRRLHLQQACVGGL